MRVQLRIDGRGLNIQSIESLKSEKDKSLLSPFFLLFLFFPPPQISLRFSNFLRPRGTWNLVETIGKRMEEGRGGLVYPDVSSRHRFFTLDLWLVLFYREQDKRRGCVGRGERLNSSNGSRKDDV